MCPFRPLVQTAAARLAAAVNRVEQVVGEQRSDDGAARLGRRLARRAARLVAPQLEQGLGAAVFRAKEAARRHRLRARLCPAQLLQAPGPRRLSCQLHQKSRLVDTA